jgi:hypothetical protein
MTRAIAIDEPRRSPPESASSGAVEVVRMSFVAEASGESAVVRRFSQPHGARAVTASHPEATLDQVRGTPAGGTAIIAFVTADAPAPILASVRAKLGADAGEAPTASVKHGSERIEWWPGRALVQGAAETRAAMQSALVDFMFYEEQLRELERVVALGEGRAAADIELAHRIHPRDSARWHSLTDAMETCSRARLTFARLEPELSSDLSSLPPAARRWLERLYEAAVVEDRAEALNDRLEALEDFYEGATQRVADFRWYREGRLLETTIILILIFECLLMAGDIYLHFAR